MNYGGKRFERGAINASGFFQVVENGCRFMPNAFKPTTGTQLLGGFERRTAIMNYGRKRFECGMIHASGIFHVVGNGCRFMPKPSNWGFGE